MIITVYHGKQKKTSVNTIKNIRAKVKFKKNKPIIIIPKKNVRLANKRNKIRRQIRFILQKNRIANKKLIINYLDKNIKPNFLDLEKTLLTQMQS